MAEENDAERTESASLRRLEQAREEGNVARSQELTTFGMLIAGAGGMWFYGKYLFSELSALLRRGLVIDAEALSDTGAMGRMLYEISIDAVMLTAPVLLLLLFTALLVPQLLSGWLFSANALRFDLQRINPLSGLSRIFSWRGLADLGKALIKALLITTAGAMLLWKFQEPLQQLSLLPVDAGVSRMAWIAGSCFLILASVMAFVAAVDVPFQIWNHGNQLKMTREELRREHRENEGDPQIKAAIRNQQRAMAQRRMMADVPKASVIVTNPTHYSVALLYEDSKMHAPRVVAKGADLLAAKIREIGKSHDVPVLEAPALARAIYHHAEVGSEIPEKLYAAVAQVLAHVFQLRIHREFGGAMPQELAEVAVPQGLDPQGAEQ